MRKFFYICEMYLNIFVNLAFSVLVYEMMLIGNMIV